MAGESTRGDTKLGGPPLASLEGRPGGRSSPRGRPRPSDPAICGEGIRRAIGVSDASSVVSDGWMIREIGWRAHLLSATLLLSP